MSASTAIIDQALLLPERERAAIAERLIASLDTEGDPPAEVEQAWAEEIERRLARIDRGEVDGVPWETARQQLRRKYRG